MSAWTCRWCNGKADPKIVPPRPRIPEWKGLGADSEEKREPVSDIDTAVVDSLKVLDLKWPIREADIRGMQWPTPGMLWRSQFGARGRRALTRTPAAHQSGIRMRRGNGLFDDGSHDANNLIGIRQGIEPGSKRF